MQPSDVDRTHPMARAFEAFVQGPQCPCLGAKAALGKGQLDILVAGDIRKERDDARIYDALRAFVRRYRARPNLFQSFAVLFEQPDTLSETAFEDALWSRAQSLSDKDAARGEPYDTRVAPDPDHPQFSLSFGGEGFFLVGLHPGASRAGKFSSSFYFFFFKETHSLPEVVFSP